MGRGPKQAFYQRRHTDGKLAHEKILNSLPVGKCKLKPQ